MPAQKLSTDSERFFTKVGPADQNGCRLWLGSRVLSRGGYGMIGTGSRAEGTFQNRRAHRFALELALGRPIAEGMMALHTCDVPHCVCTDGDGFYEINGVLRPLRGHLWEGTCKENVADRVNKDRTASGIQNGGQKRLSKLTEDQVILIRKLRDSGEALKTIAMRFNICSETVSYIGRRKTWKYIPG